MKRVFALAGLLAACQPAAPPTPVSVWTPPPDSAIPAGPLGASIQRGRALFTHTPDSLPRFIPGTLRCASCHLENGRRATAASLAGVYARFPKYMDRTGAVIDLADRVNYCFTRSLAGSKLPAGSREMQDILAYLAFLSTGVPIGSHGVPEGMPKMPPLTGDTLRGRAIFTSTCTVCHGPEGQGTAVATALWGTKSFSIGASMARQERAASFIRHNMPFSAPGSLTDQQAFDVAAYIVSKSRPDSPGKANDWPAGGAPADVPYDTKGHRAYNPPPLLPRPATDEAIVPPPPSVVAGQPDSARNR